MHSRRPLITPLALTAALALSGCAGTVTALNSLTSPHKRVAASGQASVSNPDLTFAAVMVRHHEEGVEMAEITLANANLNPDIERVAKQLKAAQEEEISHIESWFTRWNTSDAELTAAMDRAVEHVPLHPAELDALRAADGPTAGVLYLQGILALHDGAVRFAEKALVSAKAPEVRAFARYMIDKKTKNIEHLEALGGIA